MKKVFFTAAVFSIYLISAAAADPFSEIILESGVVDLRGTSALPSRNGNTPGTAPSPADLEIGSIFLTVDNHARKVVDIYEHNGRTIIETIEPRPEEVFLALYVPDFEVDLGRENIISTSIADGVTILPPDAGRADLLSSDFGAPADDDRSVTWLETDSANDGRDVLTVNVDIALSTLTAPSAVLSELQQKQEEAYEKERLKQEQETNPDGQAAAGGEDETEADDTPKKKGELDFSKSGDVRLQGTMRLVEPVFSGGVKRPKLKFSWVSKWWGGYFTIKHKSGYIKGGFESAQQLDMKLTGTLGLGMEYKIPLYAIRFKKGSVEATAGIYIKISAEGSISMAVEFSEYSKQYVGAKCTLVWPFIPTRLSGDNWHYYNFAYRPIVSAEAELKAGLYLGADIEVLGIGIMGAEAGAGAYIAADGYMEPMGIMGYDDSIGSYGSFDDWILSLSAEAGIYGEITAEILSVDMTLWEHKWPFWEWQKDWEL